MKDKHVSEVVYALADYKQLVIAYRSKYSELVKSLAFWKTSVIWLSSFMIFVVLAVMAWVWKNGRDVDNKYRREELLNAQVNAVSEKLFNIEKELAATKEELRRKEDLVKHLEKNISTTSKKLLEKLLSEQNESIGPVK